MGTPNGTMTVDGEHATITFERRLPHPLDVVWAALTEPEHLAAWLGPATVEGREGGTVRIDAGPDEVPLEHRQVTGRILVWDPPHVLEHEWRQATVGESVLRYELAADGDATILTLTHSRLDPRHAGGYVPGWHAYLDRLAARLEGAEIPGWAERYELVRPAYA